MSGICGIFDLDNKICQDERPLIIQRMVNALKHRGSTDVIWWPNAKLTLGLRLSAIPNKQKSGNIDSEGIKSNKIICLLDGSLYNICRSHEEEHVTTNLVKQYFEVRAIATLYEKYKTDFINFLDGEFSLCLWDEVEQKLILAKDQFGSRPLFFYFEDQILLFASEIKSILASQIVPIEINPPAVNDFMSFGYVPHPETMFKNIYHVEPGTLMVVSHNILSKTNYWKFDFRDCQEIVAEQDAVLTLRHLLQKAVKKRMAISTEIGAFLSGGLDSSGICCLMSKLSSKPVKAFSIGFHEQIFNELPFAKIVANDLHLEWVYDFVVSNNFISEIEKLVYLFDAPFEDTSALPSYFVARVAAEHIEVVLTGDGPDQILAGSGHHVSMQEKIMSDQIYKKILRKSFLKYLFQNLPVHASTESFANKIKRRLYHESLGFRERMFISQLVPLLVKRHYFSDDLLEINRYYDPARNILPKLDYVKNRHPIEQSLYYDMYFYMHDDLIPKVERTCTVNSLECRSPYRDKELLQFLETLPLRYRINGIETKYLLKKSFVGMLPEEIIYKKKQGFAIPRDHWCMNELQEYIKNILYERKSLERGYFKQKELKSMLANYFAGKTSYYTCSSGVIIALLTLELWHRIFIDNVLQFRH